MKINKKELLATALVCLLPVLAGAVLYPHLPETMATHWGIDGAANGWMPRAAAVFGLPVFLLAIHLICVYALGHDPKRGNMSGVLCTLTMWICPALSLLCGTVTLGAGLGHEMHVDTLVPAFVGVLFLIIGNYLPKTRQNDTMGLRLPWTLASEENWNHTHRIAGFLWVLAGLVTLVVTLLGAWSSGFFFALLVLTAGIPTLYSYCYYRRHERENEDGND